MTGDPLRVRVCIPHHFREQGTDHPYGSGQPGTRMARSLALGRCLAGLLNLQRGALDLRLHIGDRRIETMTAHLPHGATIGQPLQL